MTCRKAFGIKVQHLPEVGEEVRKARLEAAAKLSKNNSVIVNDILKNSGIVRVSRAFQLAGSLTGDISSRTIVFPCENKISYRGSSHAPKLRCRCVVVNTEGPCELSMGTPQSQVLHWKTQWTTL